MRRAPTGDLKAIASGVALWMLAACGAPADGTNAGSQPGAAQRMELVQFVANNRLGASLIPIGAELHDTGKPLDWQDFKGKVLVVAAFPTWCVPCQKAMPYYEQVRSQVQQRGVEFMQLSFGVDRAALGQWMEENRRKFPFVYAGVVTQDVESAQRELNAAIPVYYVVDREGKIVAAYSGFESREQLLRDPRLLEGLYRAGVYSDRELHALLPAKHEVGGRLMPIAAQLLASGDPLSWRDFGGKVLVVSTFATWCAPCKAAMPYYEEIRKQVQDRGVEFVQLSFDVDRQALQEWLDENRRKYGFTFARISTDDYDAALREFPITLPGYFVIGRDGRIVASYGGFGHRPGSEDPRLIDGLAKAGVHPDSELQAIMDVAADLPASAARPSEALWSLERSALKLRELASAYLATRHSGPGRARVVLALTERMPRFITKIEPAFDDPKTTSPVHVLTDTSQQHRWDAQLHTLLASVRDDSSAEPQQRRSAAGKLIVRNLDDSPGKPCDAAQLAGVLPQIEAYAAMEVEEREIRSLQKRLSRMYAYCEIPALEGYLDALARSPVPVLRKAGEQDKVSLRRQQAELRAVKFTALDGRRIDLAKLRGKVVLIDFWATWCQPCLEELPNLKGVYDEYQPAGLEVVGISIDRKEDRQKLLDSIAATGIPWPQHFDNGGEHPSYAQRFGIVDVPAVFLLDQNGTLVCASARGPALDSLVRRQLGLPQQNSSGVRT